MTSAADTTLLDVEIADAAQPAPRRLAGRKALGSLAYGLLGLAILLGVWWLGGRLVSGSDTLFAFASFAPHPALATLWQMLQSGEAVEMAVPSLDRVFAGLFWAIAIGIPVGILVGWHPVVQKVTNVPFQFLRMISPLSWMPIAVMAYDTWDAAIVFLIAIAAIWPVLFSTAAGLKRIDPAWFKVARNLGARPWHQLFVIVFPAISQDILTGIRLALGVAWIVLVPAEYLGVTSGLGYAINDARDTLSYDRLAATVVIIGIIGFTLDMMLQFLIRRLNWVKEA